MEKLQNLKDVQIKVPVNKIYQRMGYPLDYSPDMSKNRDKRIASDISDALCNIRVNLAYAIAQNTFESKDLEHMLRNSVKTVIMASTIAPSFIKLLQDLIKTEKLSTAVVYDAVASEVVDSGLSYITKHINISLEKKGLKALTRRFSAGYGDLELFNQKKIYDILRLKDLGVKISKTYMLTPEKTVTAITGIEKIK